MRGLLLLGSWSRIDDRNPDFRHLGLDAAAVLRLVLPFAHCRVSGLRTFGTRAGNFRHHLPFCSRRSIQTAPAVNCALSGTRYRREAGSCRFTILLPLGIGSHPVRMDRAGDSPMDRIRAWWLRLCSGGHAGPPDCLQPSPHGATDGHPTLTQVRLTPPLSYLSWLWAGDFKGRRG